MPDPIIRELRFDEIPLMKPFPPEDWHADFPGYLLTHYGKEYFYPMVVEMDGKIAGCGTTLFYGASGWLAYIIVLPEYRGHGLGYEITNHLKNYLHQKGCSSQLLIATDMGEPIYKKLGFTITDSYSFFKGEKFTAPSDMDCRNIRKIERNDCETILNIDTEISGETRGAFLENFLDTGWVYLSDMKQNIEGYFLPALGNGLIAAITNSAGMTLLRFKLSLGTTSVAIPSNHHKVADFLKENEFTEYRTLTRMTYGQEIKWKPNAIFSRGSGYSG